mmetsp:Transcript_11648/g.41161  ORF Transcript_11648/g.41161 Transcript_11648/m.41161 type:complete len:375 (-) Transcript_11648:113-1237(-)
MPRMAVDAPHRRERPGAPSSMTTPVFIWSSTKDVGLDGPGPPQDGPGEARRRWSFSVDTTAAGTLDRESRSPFAIIELFFDDAGEKRWVRAIGVFESAAVAKQLVSALTCPCRRSDAGAAQAETWQKPGATTREAIVFVLLCRGELLEQISFSKATLPDHEPGRGKGFAFPPACRVPRQEYAVVGLGPGFDVGAFGTRLEALKCVREVRAALPTRRLAVEHALGATDAPAVAALAVLEMYEWFELGGAGAALGERAHALAARRDKRAADAQRVRRFSEPGPRLRTAKQQAKILVDTLHKIRVEGSPTDPKRRVASPRVVRVVDKLDKRMHKLQTHVLTTDKAFHESAEMIKFAVDSSANAFALQVKSRKVLGQP